MSTRIHPLSAIYEDQCCQEIICSPFTVNPIFIPKHNFSVPVENNYEFILSFGNLQESTKMLGNSSQSGHLEAVFH